MKAYLKQDIAKKINKTVGAVQSYVDKKLVYPDVLPAQGRGFTRAYSQRNLLEFAIIAVLLDSNHNIQLETIRDILDKIRTDERLKNFFDNDEKTGLIAVYTYEAGNISPCKIINDWAKPEDKHPMIDDFVSPAEVNIRLDLVRAEAKNRISR